MGYHTSSGRTPAHSAFGQAPVCNWRGTISPVAPVRETCLDAPSRRAHWAVNATCVKRASKASGLSLTARNRVTWSG